MSPIVSMNLLTDSESYLVPLNKVDKEVSQ